MRRVVVLVFIVGCSSDPLVQPLPILDVSMMSADATGQSDVGTDDDVATPDVAERADDTARVTAPDSSDVPDTAVPDHGPGEPLDTGPKCTEETPILCDAADDYPGGCWPDGTDCTTVHKNADGTWVVCTGDQDAYVDANNKLQCCEGDVPSWCPPTAPGYPGGCQAKEADCSTLMQCGKGWDICQTGQMGHCEGDGTQACCDAATAPGWCEPNADHNGFCAQADVDCMQALDCGDAGWAACSAGAIAHCKTDGALACCGAEQTWCEPGVGLAPSFPGGCLGASADCATVASDGAGGWIACTTTEAGGLDELGALRCCGGETAPVWCAPGSGTDGTWPGDACLGVGIDCDSITKNGDAWDMCESEKQWGTTLSGELLCCGGATPTLCDGGLQVKDGDQAYLESVIAITPTKAPCTTQCTPEAFCPGPPPMKCKMPSNSACNQCVASAAIYKIAFTGACFPADQDCGKIYKCGGEFQSCNHSSCWCWENVLHANW